MAKTQVDDCSVHARTDVGDTLPSSSEAKPSPYDASASRSPSRRVLLVDDNPDVCDLFAAVLAREGHIIEIAYDGFAALDLARVFQPEVVVLDIGMPGKTGLEVAREMRECLELQPLLVALTAYGTEADRQRGFDAGFDHYCVKPARASELRALVAAGRGDSHG